MGDKVKITIDGKEIAAVPGEKILWAALDNGIYIPHLCAGRDDHSPLASCRLCFVEIEGYAHPVPSCTQEVSGGMVITTRSERVDRIIGTGFELIMSNHRTDCRACPRNHSCELQKIARERKLKLKPARLPRLDRDLPVDGSAAKIKYDPNKCVLCGHCIRACREKGAGVLGFARRGFERAVTTFNGSPLGESGCNNCTACALACPVGALALKE
ncbi:MAG: 2Fe-2S iron-sulfur cluster-binding protein [Actinobacteria bacterium]|nr:2Fe-2S iron-sulfur cluster-binding protein [Actinomycetota bacterium]